VPATPIFACQAGQTPVTVSGTLACQTTQTIAAVISYTCPAGYGAQTTPSGSNCVASSKLSTASQSTRYFHQDHLGSIAVITDEAGVVIERLAYDPWGKRRNANGLADTTDSLVGLSTDRGYTEHEHLDEVGVIHMNGRVFDPLIGRFMSADPFIQAPFELQSHNRYAYVMNNPLKYTDPSGYFAFFDEVANLGSSIANVSHQVFGNQVVQSIASIYFAANGCTGCAAAIQAGSAYDRTGSVTAAARAGLITWATAQAFDLAGDVGTAFGNHGVAHYAAHGLVGCASSVANGGACSAGALTSIATLGWQQADVNLGSRDANVAANAVVGGVTTVLGGGKFANGAITGAFSYLYNECRHGGCDADSRKVKVTGNRVLGTKMLHLEIQISDGYGGFEVLEGQPGYMNRSRRLEGRSNGANAGTVFSYDLMPSEGRTMTEFISDLRAAAASYKDEQTYGLPIMNFSWGYNSNSYVGGILDAVRVTPYSNFRYDITKAASASGFSVPGMEKPIPLPSIR
jgi:RHS repeat-associated protein